MVLRVGRAITFEVDGLRGGTRAFWWTGNNPCLPLSGVYIGEDVGNSGSCAVKTGTLDYIQSQCLIKKGKKSPPQMKGKGGGPELSPSMKLISKTTIAFLQPMNAEEIPS